MNSLAIGETACASEHKQSPLCDNCMRNVDMKDITAYEYFTGYKPKDGKCDNFLKESKFKIKAKAKI